MGQWGIRLNVRGEHSTDSEFKTWRWPLWAKSQGAHPDQHGCRADACGYLVDRHQSWGKPEEGDVPEFTIEVAYKTKDHVGNPVTPGWRYVLKWKENGQQKQMRNYGYDSKEAATMFARAAADDIAHALAPVHVETYRPEI